MIQNSNDCAGNDSSSKSVNETVNGSHHFTIRGYSLAKEIGPRKYISSDIFTVGGYDWAIYFYPDGKNIEDSSMYVFVFIALASEGTDVWSLFELTLLDQSGIVKHKVHNHFDQALESGPYTLKYRGSIWRKRPGKDELCQCDVADADNTLQKQYPLNPTIYVETGPNLPKRFCRCGPNILGVYAWQFTPLGTLEWPAARRP
ncbi:hypothetical protein HAX54_049775 [Datura stramonium]|uniref:MATH domain-containing protein n=1 Tax=Datura stramonium TaxID=4076 RepID=A0ABS8WKQ2_DATST|nr:hypothetical protein [Datura stramonium]